MGALKGQRDIDWRQIRLAIGITQSQMADLCYVTTQTIRNLEVGRGGARAATVIFLRSWLRHPDMQARLALYGVPYPFPEDL